jgi:hypothetical protein
MAPATVTMQDILLAIFHFYPSEPAAGLFLALFFIASIMEQLRHRPHPHTFHVLGRHHWPARGGLQTCALTAQAGCCWPSGHHQHDRITTWWHGHSRSCRDRTRVTRGSMTGAESASGVQVLSLLSMQSLPSGVGSHRDGCCSQAAASGI